MNINGNENAPAMLDEIDATENENNDPLVMFESMGPSLVPSHITTPTPAFLELPRVETVTEDEDEDNNAASTSQAPLIPTVLFPNSYDGVTGQAVSQTAEKEDEPAISPTTSDTMPPTAPAVYNTASVVGAPVSYFLAILKTGMIYSFVLLFLLATFAVATVAMFLPLEVTGAQHAAASDITTTSMVTGSGLATDTNVDWFADTAIATIDSFIGIDGTNCWCFMALTLFGMCVYSIIYLFLAKGKQKRHFLLVTHSHGRNRVFEARTQRNGRRRAKARRTNKTPWTAICLNISCMFTVNVVSPSIGIDEVSTAAVCHEYFASSSREMNRTQDHRYHRYHRRHRRRIRPATKSKSEC